MFYLNEFERDVATRKYETVGDELHHSNLNTKPI